MARAGRKKCPAARKRLDISSIVEKGGVALYRAAAITVADGDNGGFIFPNSDSSYLSNAQVSALSDNDLQLAINEIYARRGRIFKDASLNAYFNSQSWYEGKYTPEEFEKNVKFNTYEQKNLQLLINERRSRK